MIKTGKYVASKFHKLVILTLQCLWFLTVALPIMLYLERPPVSIYSDRSIEPAKVYPGQEITINIKAALSKDCPAEVLRTITDASGRPFDFELEARPKRESYPVKKIVPLGAYPGKAEYQATVFWKCNWVQEIFPYKVVPPPIEFEILKAPEQNLPLLQSPSVPLPNDEDTLLVEPKITATTIAPAAAEELIPQANGYAE